MPPHSVRRRRTRLCPDLVPRSWRTTRRSLHGSRGIQRDYTQDLYALTSGSDFTNDARTFRRVLKPGLFQGRDMQKDIRRPIRRRYEPEALLRVEPLHLAANFRGRPTTHFTITHQAHSASIMALTEPAGRPARRPRRKNAPKLTLSVSPVGPPPFSLRGRVNKCKPAVGRRNLALRICMVRPARSYVAISGRCRSYLARPGTGPKGSEAPRRPLRKSRKPWWRLSCRSALPRAQISPSPTSSGSPGKAMGPRSPTRPWGGWLKPGASFLPFWIPTRSSRSMASPAAMARWRASG